MADTVEKRDAAIELCRICGEPKGVHVATEKGPYTHPREARGEGIYVLVSRGSSGDDVFAPYMEWERWEFRSAANRLEET